MSEPGDSSDTLALNLTDRDLVDNLPELRWNVLHSLLGGRRNVIVDLSGVTSISSTAVAALLNLHRICRARGGRLVLQRPNRGATDVLAGTGLDRLLQTASKPARQRGSQGRASVGWKDNASHRPTTPGGDPSASAPR